MYLVYESVLISPNVSAGDNGPHPQPSANQRSAFTVSADKIGISTGAVVLALLYRYSPAADKECLT